MAVSYFVYNINLFCFKLHLINAMPTFCNIILIMLQYGSERLFRRAVSGLNIKVSNGSSDSGSCISAEKYIKKEGIFQ